MTPDLDTFSTLLGAAGWRVQRWDAVAAAGGDADAAADAEYSGPSFELRLEYHAAERYLTFLMVEREGELAVNLRLHPREGLEPILERITTAQDTLTADSYKDLVKSLIPLCDPLLIDTDDGLYRLS